MSTDEAESIPRVVNGSRLKLTVSDNALFSSVLRGLAIIKKGNVEKVQGMEVRMVDPKDDPVAIGPNHSAQKLPGGRFGEMLSSRVSCTGHSRKRCLGRKMWNVTSAFGMPTNSCCNKPFGGSLTS